MTIGNEHELEKLREVGHIVAQTLRRMGDALEPGMTTRELDDVGAAEMAARGAIPAPAKTYGFPGATCIGINPEVAHGLPSDRVIRAGDLVNIDVSAEKDGFDHPRPAKDGVGGALHEEPSGAEWADEGDDGWTLSTPPGYLTAQYEHSLVVTCDAPIILTA